MKKLFGIAALSAAVIALPMAILAADKPAEPPKTDTPKPERRPGRAGTPFTGKVAAVDKVAKTITLEGKEKQRVFHVTSETRIRKDRKPGTLDDVTVGDQVGGSYRENEGKMEVVSLNDPPARGQRAREADKGEKKP